MRDSNSSAAPGGGDRLNEVAIAVRTFQAETVLRPSRRARAGMLERSRLLRDARRDLGRHVRCGGIVWRLVTAVREGLVRLGADLSSRSSPRCSLTSPGCASTPERGG